SLLRGALAARRSLFRSTLVGTTRGLLGGRVGCGTRLLGGGLLARRLGLGRRLRLVRLGGSRFRGGRFRGLRPALLAGLGLLRLSLGSGGAHREREHARQRDGLQDGSQSHRLVSGTRYHLLPEARRENQFVAGA